MLSFQEDWALGSTPSKCLTWWWFFSSASSIRLDTIQVFGLMMVFLKWIEHWAWYYPSVWLGDGFSRVDQALGSTPSKCLTWWWFFSSEPNIGLDTIQVLDLVIVFLKLIKYWARHHPNIWLGNDISKCAEHSTWHYQSSLFGLTFVFSLKIPTNI